MHAAIQGNYAVDELTFLVSLSAGYAILESTAFAMDEWSVKADLALFESKSRFKGGISGFEREMDGRYIEQQRLKADLREAVSAQALHLAFQPMFRADGSRIECAEALARWVHPERGSIPPDVFIRLAEDMGIISDITRFVLFKACSECMVEIGKGVVIVVQRDIGNAAAIIGLWRIRRERDRFREIVDRLILLIALLIDQATIVIGAAIGGAELDRLVEIVEGLVVLAGHDL